MDAAKKRSFRIATLIVVAASVIYALIGNTLFYMAYYSEAVIANSYFIFAVMAVLFTVPVVVWFRSRYWYFPLFIPVLWVPFTIITMFIIPGLPEDDMGGGMLALYIYFLMLGAVLLGSIIGMTINGAATAWKKFGK